MPEIFYPQTLFKTFTREDVCKAVNELLVLEIQLYEAEIILDIIEQDDERFTDQNVMFNWCIYKCLVMKLVREISWKIVNESRNL